MDKDASSNCVGPLSRDHLSKLPHHVTPCMNLHRKLPCQETSDDEFSLLFRQFPFASTLPVPFTSLSRVERPILNGIDPTLSLVREKIKWQLKKDKLLKAVQKDKKNIKGKLIKKAVEVPVGGVAVVPRGVALLAQHLDRDPDPCFSGVNNWYYSGGTLATLKVNEDYYMLHSSTNKLNCSKVGDQSKLERLSEVNSEVNLLKEPIYQIVTNQRGAAVRQKTQVSVFAADELECGDVRLSEVISVSDKGRPFLSVALKSNSVNTFCTLSSVKSYQGPQAVLKLWDVEYKKKYKEQVMISPEEGSIVTDNWSSIEFVGKHTLLLADRCCVRLLDSRTGFEKKQLAWCPKKLIEMCEEISHVTQSCLRDQIVYTATTHQALCLDLRSGFVQRWTHMMATPPQFGFTKSVGDEHELLCLGSQSMLDCVAVVNSWQGDDPVSVYKPSSLPSPAKSLFQARQHGLCLDPMLTQRCSQSMTGLTWLPADQGVYVVRQSATADLFIQHLTQAKDVNKEMTQDGLTAFADWCQPTMSPQRESISVEVTTVENLLPLAKALTNPHLPIQKRTNDENLLQGKWLMSKKYMEECVDMLASQLFAVWEVDEEDEWVADEQLDSSMEQDPSEKVLNWLDKTDEDALGKTNNETTIDFRESVLLEKGKATSTPFPPPASPVPATQTAQPSQLSHNTQHTPHRSSPSSCNSSQSRRKRQKLLHETPTKVHQIQPRSASKPQEPVKKKYIPGF